MRHTITGMISGILDEQRDDYIGLTVRTNSTSFGFAVPLAEAGGMQLRDSVYITLSSTNLPDDVPEQYADAISRLRVAHERLTEVAEEYSNAGNIREPSYQRNVRALYQQASAEFMAALRAITGVENARSEAALDAF